MKTAYGNPFRFLSAFWKRLLTKPESCNKKMRPSAEIKIRPSKRRHRHGAFFELP